MKKFILYNYFRILKAKKTLMFILLVFILHVLFYVFQVSILHNISTNLEGNIPLFIRYRLAEVYGLSSYFISLGIILWIFIIFEINKQFRANFDQGIVLNFITKSMKRSTFFFSIIISIYLAFLSIVIFILSLTFLLTIFTFNFYSVELLKIYFATLLFACIHIASIITITSLLTILIKHVELSLMLNIFTGFLFSFIIIARIFIGTIEPNSLLNSLFIILSNMDSYPYFFLVRDVFHIFKEIEYDIPLEFYHIFSPNIKLFIDPDIGFPLLKKNSFQTIGYIILLITFVGNSLILYGAKIIFKNMDIT